MHKEKRHRDGPLPPASVFPEIEYHHKGIQAASIEKQSNPGVIDGWKPNIDIVETTTHYKFLVEASGIPIKNISVEVVENTLSIFLDREEAKETKNYKYHKVERSFGTSFRSFHLPDNLDPQSHKHSIKNGILFYCFQKN